MSVEIRGFDSCGYERTTLFVDDVEVWADWTHEPEDVCLSRDLDRFVRALRKLSDERDAERAKTKRLSDALKAISTWRHDALAHDEDMGHPPRDFDEDTIEEIENAAKVALDVAEAIR